MKGIYILIIRITKKIEVKIGALGKRVFNKGIYAYVGSAQNNLEKRVKRHLSNKKKMHWHIDYLLKNRFTKIIKIFHKKGKKVEECRIAKKLSKTEDIIPNFGCSDCKCKSHLFKIKNFKSILQLRLKAF